MKKEEVKYTPLRDVLLTLTEIANKSGMSLREIQRKLEPEGINLYNVCAVANGKPEQTSTIVKFDSYINGVLHVTGHDEYDLIKATLEGLTNPKSRTYQDNLSAELRNFLRNPESLKYIEYAYKRYQIDRLQEEQERLKEELSKI